MFKQLSDQDIDQMIDEGDLPAAVRNSAEKVLVVLTQDWCSDWHAVRSYLPDYEDQVEIYALEYNLHPRFEQIMNFKEETFGNRLVPYLRYYRNGTLIGATNQLPRRSFEELLKREKPFELK